MSLERLSRDDLLAALRALQDHNDSEEAHIDADELLLRYIADPEVKTAYDAIHKWYA